MCLCPRETDNVSPGTKLQRAGTAMPRIRGSLWGAPRPAARRRNTRVQLCCISSPYNSAPRALHGICVGVGPLSPAEPGENQTLAAVLRAGSAPRISRSSFAKGTVTRIACLEQTDWFLLGKPTSRALGWGRSAWAPCWPAALGRACPVPGSMRGPDWACWGLWGSLRRAWCWLPQM